MDLQTTGMEFASEMVITATLLKMRIAEVPITLYKDGRSRRPHLRSWRDGWRHLRFMLMYCPRWLFLYPGALLSLMGTIAFLMISIKGSIVIGRIGFESNSLLVSGMSILIGFQIMSFYLFTKVFAISEGFLPREPTIERFTKSFSLELGVFLGAAFFIIGMVFLGSAIFDWQKAGFGGLTQSVKLKQIIPAITLILLGVQVILSRFFLSILELNAESRK